MIESNILIEYPSFEGYSIKMIHLREKEENEILKLSKENDCFVQDLTFLIKEGKFRNKTTIVIYKNGKLIGFETMGFIHDTKQLELGYTLIDKQHRCKGLATKMLAIVVVTAILTDAVEIITETNSSDRLKYYLKRKWKVFGKTRYGNYLKLKYIL